MEWGLVIISGTILIRYGRDLLHKTVLLKVGGEIILAITVLPLELNQVQWFGEKKWMNLNDIGNELLHIKEVKFFLEWS